MTWTLFASAHPQEDIKIHSGAAWYSFPHDPFAAKDDYAYVGLVAPQGFSLGSHIILDGLESHTARSLKQAGPQACLHCILCVHPQWQPKQLPL